ncbi:MAG: VOC family protein [Pyrinomonadaceae bacterium]|nr:VOC family protein [Pyrinomonadaceae bacterium]
MKITELIPMIWTEDLDGTIAFYVDVLGFVCSDRNDDWGWVSMSIDGIGLMAARPNAHVPFDKIGFTGSFYFRTDDVDAMWAKIGGKARVCYGMEDFDWGMREFAVYDNNGYILQFGQSLVDRK